MLSARLTAGLCGLLLLAASTGAQAQAEYTPTLTLVSVDNATNTVHLSWTAVQGATGYELVVEGVGVLPVGNALEIIRAVPVGTYPVQVQAVAESQVGPPSNQVVAYVGVTPPAAPDPPTNFAAIVNGDAALLTWTNPSSSLTGLTIEVVSGPYAGITIPLSVATSMPLPVIPAGGPHGLVIKATGPGGISGASNVLDLAAGGTPCTATGIPVAASAFYGFANASWPAVPGAVGYEVGVHYNGAPAVSTAVGPSTTTLSGFAGPGNYTVNVTAHFACGTLPGATSFVSSTDPPAGPRRAADSVSLSTLNAEVASVTNAVAAAYGSDLRRSCGNNAWLFRVLSRLRAIDNRYGLNWKRGDVGVMSQDVISYNFADVPDFLAGAPHIHAWDVISGHCGPSPGPNAAYIGNPAGSAGWTLLPYMQYGYTP